jgi:transcriptional regulator with GAF, ATPase, and Fis domain
MKTVSATTPVVRSEVMRKLFQMAGRVALHDAAVLIVGETGSGKEVVVREIHRLSPRCNKALVEVNCAALPEHLMESELFGYERGAFSGADGDKPGLFEMADGGSILLDEIGEMDIKFQAKLLRVLDGFSYYRLGGSRKLAVNVRVIWKNRYGKGSSAKICITGWRSFNCRCQRCASVRRMWWRWRITFCSRICRGR